MSDKPELAEATPDTTPAPAATPPRRSPGHRGQDVRDTVAEMALKAQEISLEAGSKMAAAMKDVIGAAAGMTVFAAESARDLVQYMVRRGQMTQDEADKLIREAESAAAKRKPPTPPAAEPKFTKPGEVKNSKPTESKVSKPAEPKAAKAAAPKTSKTAEAPQADAPAKTPVKAAAKAPAKAAPKGASAKTAKSAAKTPAKSAAKAESKTAAKKPAAKKKTAEKTKAPAKAAKKKR